MNTMTQVTYSTLSVLGGAYKGGRASLKVTHTHSVASNADDSERAICGQPNMCDYAEEEAKLLPPTCPKCLAKLARLAK